jgi:DNA-3-methyladenine glycosylase II
MTIDPVLALDCFRQKDAVMARLLERALAAEHPVAIPKTKPEHEHFGSVVTSIVSQQISTRAADAVRRRVLDFLGEFTPEAVMAADFDELKACGLSNQKTKYIKHNAEVWHTLPVSDFEQMTDEEVIHELTRLYGIGRWTAEMFLIFSLARADVFSYGDLGLMNSLCKNYGYRPHYVRKIAATVESWSPHRTTASLALWHTVDNGPVLL